MGKQAQIVTRTASKVEQRRQYGQAMREIEDDLSNRLGAPGAWEAFRDGRHAFSVGTTLLGLLKQEGVFERLASGTHLDLAGLQNAVRKHANELKDRMSPGEWTSLKSVVFQGKDISETTGKVSIGALEKGAKKARSAADEAMQRLAAMHPPTPPTYPWSQQQWGRLFLDAAMNRAVGASGLVEYE